MAGRTELMRWLTRTFVAVVVLAVIGLSAVAGGM
ncbi:MAG: mammalian cell entry protein, partial [[Mycobacterium] stephanolepidis]